MFVLWHQLLSPLSILQFKSRIFQHLKIQKTAAFLEKPHCQPHSSPSWVKFSCMIIVNSWGRMFDGLCSLNLFTFFSSHVIWCPNCNRGICAYHRHHRCSYTVHLPKQERFQQLGSSVSFLVPWSIKSMVSTVQYKVYLKIWVLSPVYCIC